MSQTVYVIKLSEELRDQILDTIGALKVSIIDPEASEHVRIGQAIAKAFREAEVINNAERKQQEKEAPKKEGPQPP